MSKKRQTIAPPDKLFCTLSVELDTDYSIDECLDKLHQLGLRWLLPFAKTVKVQIVSADVNGAAFNLRLSVLRGVDCWCCGEIKPVGDGSSLVTGEVGISPEIIWFTAILIVFPIVMLIFDGDVSRIQLGGVIALVGITWAWFSAIRTRKYLIRLLEETL